MARGAWPPKPPQYVALGALGALVPQLQRSRHNTELGRSQLAGWSGETYRSTPSARRGHARGGASDRGNIMAPRAVMGHGSAAEHRASLELGYTVYLHLSVIGQCAPIKPSMRQRSKLSC